MNTIDITSKKRVIQFYRVSEPYGSFSNFSRHAIFADGRIWPTSEHYFQAMKFVDEKRQEKIRLAKTPRLAAEMGRDRDYPICPRWDEFWRDRVMNMALYAKFSQHPDLKALLLSTGEATLVEHTIKDSYWGDGGDGSGENKLGQILMALRVVLR